MISNGETWCHCQMEEFGSLVRNPIIFRTSLVVQWLRICLLMQMTGIQSWVRQLRPHML